jgi:hypothetical protein
VFYSSLKDIFLVSDAREGRANKTDSTSNIVSTVWLYVQTWRWKEVELVLGEEAT